MPKSHLVTVNGQQFSARRGDVLLDAALISGVHIPHDCRSGHCGTCRVRIVAGAVFGGDADEAKACQCRVIGDVAVAVEEVPDVATVNGRVAALWPVAPDVVELCIWLQRPFEYLPGQYFQVQFSGYPARYYSPTGPMDRDGDGRSFHLHVRRVPGGRVSQVLGREIAVGHRVKLKGPFGTAYLRPGLSNPLVLVAGGTGFAPIWSIADAADARKSRSRNCTPGRGGHDRVALYDSSSVAARQLPERHDHRGHAYPPDIKPRGAEPDRRSTICPRSIQATSFMPPVRRRWSRLSSRRPKPQARRHTLMPSCRVPSLRKDYCPERLIGSSGMRRYRLQAWPPRSAADKTNAA